MWNRTGEIVHKGPHRHAVAVCDCGAKGEPRILRDGSLRSDGCVRCQCTGRKPIHGWADTPAYNAWQSMMRRTTDPDEPGYARWGGRGIKVCRWWQDVRSFCEDMSPRPDGMSLERPDNNRGYDCGECPDCKRRGATRNAKWAPKLEQANNTRSNVFIEHNGKRQTIAQWARETGVGPQTLWNRYRLRGETGDRLFRPAIRLREYPKKKQ